MILRGKNTSLIMIRSKDRPERQSASIDGIVLSHVRPFLEIGIADQPEYRLHYFGIWKFLLAVATRGDGYRPIWVEREERLAGVLMFRKIIRRKGHDSVKF